MRGYYPNTHSRSPRRTRSEYPPFTAERLTSWQAARLSGSTPGGTDAAGAVPRREREDSEAALPYLPGGSLPCQQGWTGPAAIAIT